MKQKNQSDRPWKRKLTTRHLCDRYGVCAMTIDRWTKADILPPPMMINGIRYFDEDEVDARDQERMAAARNSAAA